jgi:deazaflavin-dependent oxidoreductase (nitroreductase family)
MSDTTPPTPKLPPAWFKHAFWRCHRVLYRLSGGQFLWTPGGKRGWGTLHLTATGRKSGRPRTVIIAYLEDGPNPFTLAMNGWDEGHPAWWLNLQANPDVAIRLPRKPEALVRARTVTGEERERLWRQWLAIEPDTDAYARERSVETPVVVFEPRDSTPKLAS